MQSLAPTSPSRLPQSGGIYLKSANAERLQAIADAIHELHMSARAFEQTEAGTWARSLAGASLDCALNNVKALRGGM